MPPRTHECPGGCGRRVPPRRYACENCWYRLPVPHREALRQRNHLHGDAYRNAMFAAHQWFAAHPLSTPDSQTS